MTVQVASHITPLWVTAQGGHEKVLVELLRSGADVSICDPEGRSPLLIAAEGGHLGVIKLLLGQNADMLDGDIRGRTAAFLAAEHGHTEVLQVRLNAQRHPCLWNWLFYMLLAYSLAC